MEDFFDLPVS
jgi:transposase